MGFVICSVLYFLPTIVAARRGHRVVGMFLLNFFLGWTIVGWVALLAWAFSMFDYRAYYGDFGWYGRSWRPWDGRPLAPVYCWTCRRPY